VKPVIGKEDDLDLLSLEETRVSHPFCLIPYVKIESSFTARILVASTAPVLPLTNLEAGSFLPLLMIVVEALAVVAIGF
jgi:hypothetical protein